MEQRNNSMRIFITAFIVTLIAAAFLLSLGWVSMKAEESGFEGYSSDLSVQRCGDLCYVITVGEFKSEVDLTPIDRAAAKFQAAEGWIVAQDIRIMSRLALLAAEHIKDNRYQIKEEFYKNAGLV